MNSIDLTTEKDVREPIQEYLTKQGVLWWSNVQKPGRKYRIKKGKPDIEGRWKGFAFWVEVKKPKGVVSESQIDFHEKVRQHGDKIFVAFSFEAFRMEWEAWLRDVKAGRI